MHNEWRNNKKATIWGFPVAGIFPYLLLIYITSLTLFTLITLINIVFTVLHHLGYSPTGFLNRLLSKVRGPVIYSRPWWIRERWSKK